jgi:hypothetical protein
LLLQLSYITSIIYNFFGISHIIFYVLIPLFNYFAAARGCITQNIIEIETGSKEKWYGILKNDMATQHNNTHNAQNAMSFFGTSQQMTERVC